MPEDKILTALSSYKELDRLSKIVDTAENKIAKKAETLLDQSISTAIPPEARRQIIISSSQQIAHQAIRELSRRPNLGLEEYALAQKHAVEEAVDIVKKTNHAFFNLTSRKNHQQLTQQLQDSLDNNQAQQTAQASNQYDQVKADLPTPQSPQELAKIILQQEGENYQVDENTVEKIIKDVQSQTQELNTTDSQHIDLAVKQAVATHLPTQALQETVGEKISTNRNLIKEFIEHSNQDLPRKTPFTPFQPYINSKTLRQAKRFNVHPLALAYVKTGTPRDNHLPQYLQTEIIKIHNYIDNPATAQGFFGRITSSSLQPQVFFAQKYYHPAYTAYNQAIGKSNKFLEKPYDFYQTTNQKYQDLLKSYQTLIQEKPLGWAIAPRQRLRYEREKTKIKIKKRFAQFVDKSKPLKAVSKFWGNWSPKALKRKAAGWTIKKTAQAFAWLGAKTGLKFLTTISALILETSSVIGIPLIIAQVALGAAKGLFTKLKRQIKKQKYAQDTAGVAAKALQMLFGGLKALGALALGSLGGLIGSFGGAIAGFLIGTAIGTPLLGVVTGILGFFAGGALGTALGGLIGFNWMTLAAIPATVATALTGFFSTLTGGVAVPTAAAAIGLGSAGVTTYVAYQNISETSSAFFIPEDQLASQPTAALPNIVVTGTCPITQSPWISIGSYTGSSGHGGPSYSSHCYGIPIYAMWPWLDDNRPDNDPVFQRCPNAKNTCNDQRCPYYGYATDVHGAGDVPLVSLPSICLPDDSDCQPYQDPMTWKITKFFYNCNGGDVPTKKDCHKPDEDQWGWSVILESDDNNHHWKIYLNHIDPKSPLNNGQQFTSGDVLGTITQDDNIEHLHIELVVDGIPVKPDYLCQ